MPTQGNDKILWNLADGPLYIDGLGDSFDVNYYAHQSRDEGFAHGDLLRVDGGPVVVRMTSWDSGTVQERGGARAMGATFTGIEQVYGSDGNDVFRAGRITEALDGWRGVSFFGGGGDDDIGGSRFDDFLDPGDGNDIVRAGAGNDHVDASRGDDTVYGGPGDDNIRWGGGNSAWLAPGDDFLTGGGGNDLVNLWAHYGDGENAPGVTVDIRVVRADGAMVGTGTVQINEAGDTDTARFRGFEQGWTHQGSDTIDASGAVVRGDLGITWGARWGDDMLIGSRGNDTLEGGPGADTLQGGAGDDLIATAGDWYNMHAAGDGDADLIVFRPGDGHDTVTGFDVGIDRLDLGGADHDMTRTDDGLLITLDDNSSILLVDVMQFI